MAGPMDHPGLPCGPQEALYTNILWTTTFSLVGQVVLCCSQIHHVSVCRMTDVGKMLIITGG